MPKRTDIKKILIIGSGPIVIGQACEFDYSGTQACKSLQQEGFEVVLVNSNPATIMTDPDLADRTYIEPLTAESIAAIIARERPDALLPTVGGQTGLNVVRGIGQVRRAGPLRRGNDRSETARRGSGGGPAVVQRRHDRDRPAFRPIARRKKPVRGEGISCPNRAAGDYPAELYARWFRRRNCIQRGRVRDRSSRADWIFLRCTKCWWNNRCWDGRNSNWR